LQAHAKLAIIAAACVSPQIPSLLANYREPPQKEYEILLFDPIGDILDKADCHCDGILHF
jgi:hypothetical protein